MTEPICFYLIGIWMELFLWFCLKNLMIIIFFMDSIFFPLKFCCKLKLIKGSFGYSGLFDSLESHIEHSVFIHFLLGIVFELMLYWLLFLKISISLWDVDLFINTFVLKLAKLISLDLLNRLHSSWQYRNLIFKKVLLNKKYYNTDIIVLELKVTN